jgi:alkyl hydroperoxide reductase subunit AhpC
MYAHALDARLRVLFYASPGVWLVRAGFVTPTRRIEGGFRFSTEDATFRKPRLPPNRTIREIFSEEKLMSTDTLTETAAKTLRINDTAPDFTADTTQGTINFHEWIGDGWAVLFSHPKDFTPVCTTELGYMAGLQPEFAKRNTKIIGLSVDPVTNHSKWAADIEETQGHKVNYPMIGDTDLKIAKLYGMLPAESGHTSEGRTAADNATVRTVFVVGPDKKIKLMLIYPMSTGRNFDEVLRVLDSMQLTAKHKVATPVNWKQGGDVIILPAVSNEEAQQKYPGGWKSPKPYLRIVPQPK